jgi:hypothetical protein
MKIALSTIYHVLVFIVAQLLRPGQLQQLKTMRQAWQTVVRKVWLVVGPEIIRNQSSAVCFQ